MGDVSYPDPINYEMLRDNPEAEAARLCAINLGNLEEVMVYHSVLVAHVAMAAEVAKVRAEEAKWYLTRMKSGIFIELMNVHKSVGATERAVDNDQNVHAAADDYYEKLMWASKFRALMTALDHRRDFLIQLSSRQRAEMQNY